MRSASESAASGSRVVNDRSGNPFLDLPPTRFGGAQGITQLVTSDGVAIQSPDASVELPVTERARQVAAGDGDSFFADADVTGTHLRVYTVPVDRPGFALQIARPLDEVDAALGANPRPPRPDRRSSESHWRQGSASSSRAPCSHLSSD